jgi:FkbM family methyltransferase
MNQIAGRTGKVIAFEPQIDAAKLLRTTQAVMGWNNVHVECCGMSDKNGISPLYSNTHAT